MKLKIEINGGNDAVQTSEDFSFLLIKTAAEVLKYELVEVVSKEGHSPFRKTLHDSNGNVVGLLSIEK